MNMEEVEKLYKEYQAAKDRAEQYMFPFIAMFDRSMEYQYNDLKKNHTVEHERLLIKNLKFMISKIS